MINFKYAKASLFLLLGIIGFSGCKQNTSQDIRTIDIVGNLNNTIDVKLSAIADEVSYIPLETKPDCLLSYGYYITPTEDYLFISDNEKPLLVFDKNGRFVRKIGAIGNGPGEYRSCLQFHLDEEKQEVYILNRNKEFLRYSWEGEFIGTKELPYRALMYYPLNEGGFLLYYQMQQSRDSVFFRTYFTDKDFNFISAVREEQENSPFYGIIVGARAWQGEIMSYAQMEFCDTIYSVQNNSLIPETFLDFGDTRMGRDMFADYEHLQENMNTYIVHYYLTENEDYWQMFFSYKEKSYLGFINHEEQEIHFAEEVDTTRRGLINNIDGGPGFFPTDQMKGGSWYVSIPAFEFMNWNESGLFDKEDILQPEANKALKEMASSLSENDNPIIMVIQKRDKLKL